MRHGLFTSDSYVTTNSVSKTGPRMENHPLRLLIVLLLTY